MANQRPIGVFDSGVGGLTVVRALGERLPGEELIYLGDTARVPYGSKSAETVARYSRMSTRFLLERDVKMIVIACNTASAYALEELKSAVGVPVLGAVEPGARAAVAATRSGKVGVIGTLGTVRSGAYPRAIAEAAKAAGRAPVQVTAHPCPLLVPLAEEGWTDGAVAEAVARRYLDELAAAAPELDVLLLGCTHYPLLRGVLERVARERFGHDVKLVDSAEAMAHATFALLALHDLARMSEPVRCALRCYVTDDARIEEVGARFFGRPLGPVERVDL
jgi:glutamate racemase